MTTSGDPTDRGEPPRRPIPTLIEAPEGTFRDVLDEARSQAMARPTLREGDPFVLPATMVEPRPAAPAASPPADEGDTAPYRPTARAPMAVLVAVDDGAESGEAVRIRAPRFVIGRVTGDLVIPHDDAISGQHAEIVRRQDGDRWTWHLADLRSANGTFFRASKIPLSPNMEILLGGLRYRFDLPARPAAGGPSDVPATTRKWLVGGQGPAPSPFRPALVEQVTGRRFEIAADDLWIGRDPARCSIAIDDPMLGPRHARIYRDEGGRWVLAENPPTRNRIWFRVNEAPLGREAQFQCGEQRFRFKVL
ncbi:FHA domain-containing protein [Tundrisphaera sp. TA3]|uniref:FHA domain-containing protein n=1 Tax=Tundrisphaera sp. TA3 TaxID=3435775 RepID=UPI003EBDCAAA